MNSWTVLAHLERFKSTGTLIRPQLKIEWTVLCTPRWMGARHDHDPSISLMANQILELGTKGIGATS
jgi:hypothetical protein